METLRPCWVDPISLFAPLQQFQVQGCPQAVPSSPPEHIPKFHTNF